MAKYRAKVKCFVGNGLREEGDEFDYDGPPNGCLERVGEAAQKADDVQEVPPKKWTPRARRASADKATA